MTQPQRRPVGRISNRLLLLGLLNFAGFVLVIAILIHAFRSMEEMTSAAAEGQMARAALNASAVRQVSALHPLTLALTAALGEPDGHLAAAGAELQRTLGTVAASSLNPEDRATFTRLSEHLTRFVAHGESHARLSAEVAAREGQALAAIADLERALIQYRLAQTPKVVQADQTLARLQVQLVTLREALLEQGRIRARGLASRGAVKETNGVGKAEPQGAEPPSPDLASLAPGLAALADTPGLAEPAAALQAQLASHQGTSEALDDADSVLADDLQNLHKAEAESLRLMARLDQDTLLQSDRFRQNILDIMFRSAVSAITAALLVGLVTALMLLVILRRQIKEPMEGVIASVNAISGGGFHDLKPLGGADEWEAIQGAIENMADELSRTYSALAESEARYRLLVDNQSDLVVKVDAELRLRFVNPAFCEAMGMPESDLLGQPCTALIHPDDPLSAGEAIARLDAPPHDCHIEQHTRTPKGWRWYAWVYRALPGPDGRGAGAIGVGRDITALKGAETSLEDQRRFLHTVIDAVSDPILVIARDHEIRMANAAARRLYGWGVGSGTEADPEGAHECCHQILHRSESPCSLSAGTCPLEQVQASRGSVRGVHRHWLNGGERYMEVSASPYWGADGEIAGVVEVGRDITEELAAQERVQFLAHHDVLTGLPNRVQLYERFGTAAEGAAGAAGRNRVGLLYLDLDGFKDVNDNFGHHIGDLLLQEVAHRLSGAVRKTDTVSRQGGDEFLVVLPELHDAEGALGVAEKIRASLETPIVLEGHELRVSFSIGAAILPEDGTDFDTLLKHADLAMYAAKAAGRNSVCRYDRAMERRSGHAA